MKKLAILFFLSAILLTSFSKTDSTTKPETQQKAKTVNVVDGYTFIELDDYGWYRLMAVNTSGECIFLTGKVRFTKTGVINTFAKEVPSWASDDEKAVCLFTSKDEFTKIESSIVAKDCM